MKIINLFLLIYLSVFNLSATTVDIQPTLAGFYPDPSICRVGSDYYLVNSSFSFYPGLPIFHSKDLSTWTQIGNAIDRPDQIDFSGLGLSQGVYAPTLRYHEGTYYIVCTIVGGINNFVITAKHPQGPWSQAVALPHVEGMDPDLFFDDNGKAYISSCAPAPEVKYDGHRAIKMYQFFPETLTTSRESVVLVDGGARPSDKPIWCEGPHLYKINNYYYLLCAEGGTSTDHSEVVFRSSSLDGPFVAYANNPILSQRHLSPQRKHAITNTGHADMVQTADGSWKAFFLGCRPYSADNEFNTGRETFMHPVTWENDWPIILSEKEEMVSVMSTNESDVFPLTGNFSYTEEFMEQVLPDYFLFLRAPQEEFFQLSPNGGLNLSVLPSTLDEKVCPAFIGRRQQHARFQISAQLQFEAKGKELAGLAAVQNDEYYYLLAKTSEGFTVSSGKQGVNTTLFTTKVKDYETCFLKITGDDALYRFFYSFDNANWIQLGKGYPSSYLSTPNAGGFVGTILGMYASSDGQYSTNSVQFNSLQYMGTD